MPLAAHGATHPGRRSTNEDSLLVDLALGLFVVADGMGGHNAGEIASHLAVTTVHDFLATARTPPAQSLEDAVCAANDEILTTAARQPDYAGMGTTVVAAIVSERSASYTSVGDSRVYLWRHNNLTLLTQDDSWATAAIANGTLAEDDDVQRHPMRHVLTRVVGLRPELQPTVFECPLETGDALLLCTDGLHGSLPEAAIAAALATRRAVAEIAEGLVSQAIARGATDNVTAVVIRRD